MSAYRDAAQRACDVLTTRWFTSATPKYWVPDDYWKTPTIICELIDYAVLTGDPGKPGSGVRDTLDNAFAAGKDWLESAMFFDDLAAWGRMFVAAHGWLAAGDPKAAEAYRQRAVGVYDQLDQSWDDVCKGGIRWLRDPDDPRNFKASVSTMQYADIAAGLGEAAAAQRAWSWESAAGLVDERHVVWGGTTPKGDCARDPGNPPVPADQGHTVGALWGLYALTKDESWLTAACEVAAGAIAAMTWDGTQILKTAFDEQWRTASEDFRKDHIDHTLSKGLFMQNLGPLAAGLAALGGRWQTAADAQAAFLRANADGLVAQYPHGVYDMDWLHGDASYDGDSEDQISASLQYSALAAFVAAAKLP